MKFYSSVSLLMLAPFLPSCQSSSSSTAPVVGVCQATTESDGPGVTGIIGGQKLNPSGRITRGTVFLLSNGNSCTGVIISPKHILTAAHCVPDVRATGRPEFNLSTKVIFSNNVACTAEMSDSSRIRSSFRTLVHRDYRSGPTMNDLAVVELASEAPSDVIPFSVPTENIGFYANQIIHVAGYGKIESLDSSNTDLMLRYKTLVVHTDPVKDLIEAFKTKEASDHLQPGFPLLVLKQEAGGVCSGDSGGPAFSEQNSRLVLEGIASFVFDNNGVKANCHSGAAYTSVRAYSSWIKDAVDALK